EREQRPYFTMEWLPGGSLAERLNSNPQPAREAAELIVTLAEAMQYAHEQGVVHRDLKPANVLLNAECGMRSAELDSELRTPHSAFGTPRMTASGPARLTTRTQEPTRIGQWLGTPEYMAPEQAGPAPGGVGPHTDVHALGVMLYEMLTGRPPFKAHEPLE